MSELRSSTIGGRYALCGEIASGGMATVHPASGRTRAMRGGAWNGGYTDWVRPSFRFHDAESTRSHGVGFRCAKTL